MPAPLVFARPEPLEPHILAHLAAQCSSGDSDYSPDATEESNNQSSNDTTDVKSNGSSLQDVHRLAGLNPPDDISSSPKALAALTNVRDVVLATPLLAKASLSEAAQRGPAIALRSELLSRSTADDSSSEDSVVTLSGLRVPRGLVDAPPLSLNALHLYHIDILPQVWDDLYGRRPAESSTVYRPSSPKQSNTMRESLSASAAALPGMSRILDAKRTHFNLSGAAQNSAKVARDEKEESRAHGNPATEDVALAWKQLHIPRPAYSEADLKEWCETHPVVRQHVLLDRQAPEWAAKLPWLNGTYVSQLHSHVCHGGTVPSESPLLRGKHYTQQSGKQSELQENTRAATDAHGVYGQQTKQHEDTSAAAAATGTTTAATGTTTAASDAHIVSSKTQPHEDNPATGAYASGKRERGPYGEQYSSHPTLNSKTGQPMTETMTNFAKNQNKHLERESPIQTSMDISAPLTTYSSHSTSSRGRSRVRTARPSQRTSEKLLSGTRGSLVREMTSENGTIVRQELLHIFFIARQSLTTSASKKESSSSNVRGRLYTNANRSPNSQQRRTRSCIPSRSSNHEQIHLDGPNQMVNGSNQMVNGSNQREKTLRDNKVESSEKNPLDTIELISKYFPTLRDASIIAPREKTIVANRVYAAFYNRRITYSYDTTIASDKKKVHSRRDAEIVRIKKYLLRKLQDRVALGIPLIPVKTIRPEAMRRRSLTPTSKGPQGLDDQSNRSDSLGTSASREHSSYTSSSADSARSSRGDIHAANADSSSSSSGARKSALSGSDPALEDGHGNSSFDTDDTKGKHYAKSTSSDVNQLSGSSSGASSRLHSRYTSSSSSSFSDTHGDKSSNQRKHRSIDQPMFAHTSDISMDNSSSSSSAHSTEESTLKPTISDAIPVSTVADAINTTTTTMTDSNMNDTDMTTGKTMTNSVSKTSTDLPTTTTTMTSTTDSNMQDTSMTSVKDSNMQETTMTSMTDSSPQNTNTSTSTATIISTGNGTLSGPQQINHDLGQGISPDGLLVNSFESLDPFLVPIAALPAAVRRNVVKLSESMRESGYHYHDLDYDIEYSEDIVTPLLMDVDSQELVRAETQGTSVHDATAVGREENASIPPKITTDNKKADIEKDESDILQSPRNIPTLTNDTEDGENEKPARAAEIARALRSAAGFDPMTSNGADSSTTGRSSTAPADQPRPSRNLPPSSVQRLRDWLFDPRHVEHPYPSENEKKLLETESGLNRKQLNNWFTNARKRIWQPELERQRTDKQTDSFNEMQSTNQLRTDTMSQNNNLDDITKHEVQDLKQHPSVISAPPKTGVHGPHFSTHEKHKSRSAYNSSDVVTKPRPPLVQNFSYPPDVRNLRPNNTFEAVGMPRSRSQIQSARNSNIGMVPLSNSHSMHQNLTSWLPVVPPEQTMAFHPTENTISSDQKSKQQSQTTNTFTQDTNTSTTQNQPSNRSNQQSAAIPEEAQYIQQGKNGNAATGQSENVSMSRSRTASTYSAPPFNMTHVSSMNKPRDVPEEYAEKMALDALNKYFEWTQYLQHKHGNGTQTTPQQIPFPNPTQKNDRETHASSGTKPSYPVGPFHAANGQQYSLPQSNMHGIHPSMLSHPQYQYYNMYDTMNYPQSSMHTQNQTDQIQQRSMINEQKNNNSSSNMNKNAQTIEKESDHFPRYPPPPSHFGVPIQSSGNNGVSVPHVGPAQHAPQLPTHASRETDMPSNQIDNSGKILQDGSLNQPIPSHTMKQQYHPYYSTTYPMTHGGMTMTDTPYHSRQHPYPYFADETNFKNEISKFTNGSNFDQLGPRQRIQYARHLANQILNSSTTSGSYSSFDSSNKNSSQSEETLARQRKASDRHAARYGKRNMSTEKDNKTLSTNQPNESSSKRRKTSCRNDPNTGETTTLTRSKNVEQTSQENESGQTKNTNNVSSQKQQKPSASTKNQTTKRRRNSTACSDTSRTRKRTRSSRSSQQQQQDHSSSYQSKESLSHQKSSTNSTDPKQLTNNTNSTQSLRSKQQNKSSHKLNTGNPSGGDNTAHNTHSTGSESSSHDERIGCENTGSEHTGSEHTSENTTSENHGTSEEGLAATNSREGRSTGSAGTGTSRQLLEDQLKNDTATNALLAAANVIEQAAAQESKQRSKTDTQNNHQHGGNQSSDQELSGTGAIGYHTGGSSGFGESYRSFSIGDSRSGSRHTSSTDHHR